MALCTAFLPGFGGLERVPTGLPVFQWVLSGCLRQSFVLQIQSKNLNFLVFLASTCFNQITD